MPWRDKRQRRNERQRCRQMGGGGVRRGDTTTSRTRGVRGNGTERGMTRGDGTMRGGVTSRWEAAGRRERQRNNLPDKS
jgi:hypothetical protein